MQKFRPVLTLEEIQYLEGLLAAQEPSELGKQIQAKLRVLICRIDVGLTLPAYVTTPKPSIETLLGSDLTPQERREAAYIKYKGSPESCSRTEVNYAKAYMYTMNMMTEQECEAYEQDQLGAGT